MDIIYKDNSIVVCIKPAGTLSTDEPGGLPELVRNELNEPNSNVRTVHRLDRVVSGLMVLARNATAASELSRQVREDQFRKEYMAIVHGQLPEKRGEMRDLLCRDKRERKTYVTDTPGKYVREAVLEYERIAVCEDMSLVRIKLITGRTHQIRAQFSSRSFPLVGDKKYGPSPYDCPIALWSAMIGFHHPETGEEMEFFRTPPGIYPWTEFRAAPL